MMQPVKQYMLVYRQFQSLLLGKTKIFDTLITVKQRPSPAPKKPIQTVKTGQTDFVAQKPVTGSHTAKSNLIFGTSRPKDSMILR